MSSLLNRLFHIVRIWQLKRRYAYLVRCNAGLRQRLDAANTSLEELKARRREVEQRCLYLRTCGNPSVN